MLVIVCLGNEPMAFGPFNDNDDIEDELWMHIDVSGICFNGNTRDDHHVITLDEGFFQQMAKERE